MESSDPTKTTSPPPTKHDHHPSSSSKPNDDDHHHQPTPALSSPNSHKSTSIDPAIQPPPNQEMEAYRIPPSVFERNKSSTPADWSATSNESLFSIHMENMSFAKDPQWKSGDLGAAPAASDQAARLSTSDLMFGYSGHPSAGGAADMRSRELGIAEATMLEVIKENEGRSRGSSLSEVRNTHRSPGSNQSNMSFAFSTAGRDTERINSSVKSSVPHLNEPELEPDAETTPAAKEKGAQTQSKWFFCFPCCSFCS